MEEKKKSCCEPNVFRRAIRKILRTERMYQTVLDSRMAALNIHRSQRAILQEIGCEEGRNPGKSLSQKDIAERFGISAAAVAMTLKKMEAEGYIRRAMSEADNRYNELFLTDKGRGILSESGTIVEELDSVVYHGLTKEEVDAFLNVIYKMQENLMALPELNGKPLKF